MTWDECLSVMELLELRELGVVEDSPEAIHLRSCPRCRAALQTMPSVASVAPTREVPQLKARPISRLTADDVRAGQIWTATDFDVPDRRFIVVVVGKRKDTPDTIVVCPTSVELDQATDLDLIVDPSTIGHPFMICAWHFGTVFRSQLENCLGSLHVETLEGLKGLYQHALTGKGDLSQQVTGTGMGGSDDLRQIWRSEQLEQWRPLWHPVRHRLAVMETAAGTHPVTPRVSGPSLGDVVRELVGGEEWDARSLIEAAHVPAAHLGALLSNRLDLTDQSDAESVAAIIHALALGSEEVEQLLRGTLEASPGGLRIGTAGTTRIAARSFAHVSDETRAKELRDSLSKVDDSPEARNRAVDSYVDAVLQRLDELT